MNDTKIQLNKIIGYLTSKNRHVTKCLLKGISLPDLQAKLMPYGLDMPVDFIEMYQCFNGTRIAQGDELDDLHFFPGFYWMSIEDMVSSYKSFQNDPRWNKSWLPVFANGGGDFYCVVCDKNSPEFGQVIGFMLGEPDSYVEFSNLHIMLTMISECFSEGIYYVSDGYLEANYKEAMGVAKNLCPELNFYQ